MLNSNTVPAKETLMPFLQNEVNEKDSINADIGKKIVSVLRTWLKKSSVPKQESTHENTANEDKVGCEDFRNASSEVRLGWTERGRR